MYISEFPLLQSNQKKTITSPITKNMFFYARWCGIRYYTLKQMIENKEDVSDVNTVSVTDMTLQFYNKTVVGIISK